MHEYVFYFVRLLDLDADPNAVDTWLDENLLILVPGDI